jgi:hypothetical protein
VEKSEGREVFSGSENYGERGSAVGYEVFDGQSDILRYLTQQKGIYVAPWAVGHCRLTSVQMLELAV